MLEVSFTAQFESAVNTTHNVELGSVFTALKAAHPKFAYTALARKERHFPAIEAAGATPILGSFADHDVIAQAAYEADLVINCSFDDVGLIKAIIEGSKKRKSEGKSTGILIHTSGTMAFLDKTREGKFVEGMHPRNVSVGSPQSIRRRLILHHRMGMLKT
jgi:hypothetical protein